MPRGPRIVKNIPIFKAGDKCLGLRRASAITVRPPNKQEATKRIMAVYLSNVTSLSWDIIGKMYFLWPYLIVGFLSAPIMRPSCIIFCPGST
jgi:hypothetical protein